MTEAGPDLWSERADRYRQSAIHAEGEDLDLVVSWCEPGPGVTVLDVATGGGHVARRLREAGATVVTVDPAPGMKADTTAPAESLPFADASFDAVACRLAAHHFADVLAAVREMARVARHRVVICDNTFVSESSEEADRVRDPSHVRNYSQPEWRASSSSRGSASATSSSCCGLSRSSPGSPASTASGQRRPACGSSSATGSATA